MATTGDPLYPGSGTFPGSTTYPGQGSQPTLEVLYSTDDASASSPRWTYADGVRGFSISRGRSFERDEVAAGTAQITLDNRTRDFDPTHNSAIRPMNRWWIRESFSGEKQDLFKGYAESYDMQWPAFGKDAVCVVSLADEFKVLALHRLPVTNPPRDSYAEVVSFDAPDAYWRMNDMAGSTGKGTAVVGKELVRAGGGAIGGDASAIVGDVEPFAIGTSGAFLIGIYGGGEQFTTGPLSTGESGDASGLAEFTIEAWLKTNDATPATNDVLIRGPLSGSAITWQVSLTTAGLFTVDARNSGGTTYTVSSAAIQADRWYHVVGTITGGSLRLYVDGSQVASTAFTGTFGAMDANSELLFGDGSIAGERSFDEVAFYRAGLSAARVSAHYVAGASRGFAAGYAAIRVAGVLDTVVSSAPRRISTPTGFNASMHPAYMTGQPALDELRQAARAESPNGLLFVGRDGVIVFLDTAHRSASPYNTVQATFDDDGTDLAYHDIDVDYSDSFIANDVNVTRSGGPTQSASDTTSISRYGKRTLSVSDLPIYSDAETATVASAVLAKYKDPMFRVLSLSPKTSAAAVAENVYRRDIGDRIRVFLTPPGGGSRIDQTVFIQSIVIEGVPGQPFRVVWGVSPL